MIPFTAEQFFEVFAAYNAAIWPAQWVLTALAFTAVALTVVQVRRTDALVAGTLVLFWTWMGLAYHLAFFRTINPAATVFGIAFLVQAALFAHAVFRGHLAFRVKRDASGAVGGVLLAYALLVYPFFGYVLGHRYPATPTFGAPCPTTIFSFGLLLWTDPRVPLRLLVVPGLWAVIGLSAAVSLGVLQDIGLFLAGAVAVTLVVRRRRLMRTQTRFPRRPIEAVMEADPR